MMESLMSLSFVLISAVIASTEALLVAGAAVLVVLGILGKYAGDHLFHAPEIMLERFDKHSQLVSSSLEKLSDRVERNNVTMTTDMSSFRERLAVVEQASLRLPDVERKLDAIILAGLQDRRRERAAEHHEHAD